MKKIIKTICVDFKKLSNYIQRTINSIKKYEHKEIVTGYLTMFVSITYSLKSIIKTIFSIYTQRNSYINLSVAALLIIFLIQLSVFVILTYYDYWNYHNRKMLLIRVMPITIVTFIGQMLSYLYGITIRPAIYMLPVTDDITPVMIVNISRLLNTVLVSIPLTRINRNSFAFSPCFDYNRKNDKRRMVSCYLLINILT